MLFSQMTPPAAERDAFEDWYDGDHIARRLVLPGYDLAHRFWNIDGDGHHLAVYELDSMAALQSQAYLALKADPGPTTEHFLRTVSGFTRFTTSLVSDVGDRHALGRYLSVVAFSVPEEDVDAFEDWYAAEHEPRLLDADSWLRIRRYRVVDGEGGPWTHLALHELADLEVMDSPERAHARTGPRRDALATRPWFSRSGRWLYRRVVTHHADRS
jgi:hypothetical protein